MPFAGYKNWDECVKDQIRKGKSKESAAKICGYLEKKSKEKHGEMSEDIEIKYYNSKKVTI